MLGVMLYQLSYGAPWEQGGGEESIQVLVHHLLLEIVLHSS